LLIPTDWTLEQTQNGFLQCRERRQVTFDAVVCANHNERDIVKRFQQALGHISLLFGDARGWSRFVAMQNHYNLVYREEEREMIPLCRAEGIGITPWSPLARGFLAGNRTRDKKGETTRAKDDPFAYELYYRDEDFTIAERVAELARKRGVKPTQIALAWMLNKSEITAPIIGATKAHHLPEAVAALDIKLTDDERTYIETPYVPHPVLGHS
jgi:aryl-alcohol dehydrogenase-like predicted oxidoreductase